MQNMSETMNCKRKFDLGDFINPQPNLKRLKSSDEVNKNQPFIFDCFTSINKLNKIQNTGDVISVKTKELIFPITSKNVSNNKRKIKSSNDSNPCKKQTLIKSSNELLPNVSSNNQLEIKPPNDLLSNVNQLNNDIKIKSLDEQSSNGSYQWEKQTLIKSSNDLLPNVSSNNQSEIKSPNDLLSNVNQLNNDVKIKSLNEQSSYGNYQWKKQTLIKSPNDLLPNRGELLDDQIKSLNNQFLNLNELFDYQRPIRYRNILHPNNSSSSKITLAELKFKINLDVFLKDIRNKILDSLPLRIFRKASVFQSILSEYTKKKQTIISSNEAQIKSSNGLSDKKRFENKPPNLSSNNTSLLKPPKSSNPYNFPDKYLEFIKIFGRLEFVVTIRYNRQQACTFDKAREVIERLAKKDFTLKQLGQLITIYPNAYKLSWEKIADIDNPKNQNYHLIIRPNVTITEIVPYTNQLRRRIFIDKLYMFARRAHDNYLLSLNEPIPTGTELVRWHPGFAFPDIPEAKLLEAPANEMIKSPNEFWSKKNFKKNSPESNCDINQIDDKIKIKSGVLKGLSQKFVDKVRNKGAMNNQLVKYRNPKIVEKINKTKELPELVRELQSLFTIEKKKVISLADVIKKCTSAQTKYSSEKFSDLIYLINENLPHWLLILNTSRGTFIKINTEMDLNELYYLLNHSIIKLEAQF